MQKTFTFTKQLKEDWLKALKSGEFEQFGGKLRNPDNHKEMCCLGVLAHIHPDIEISKCSNNCTVNGKNVDYLPFNKMKINKGALLTCTNDISYHEGIRNYSVVIPLIEQLPTVD